ncbi:hypothetical protein NFI96_013936 [Prochilodus magdalenae]|nr:hypothetical protein NFI96_013936 [Prochilodus magdalenae]
MKGLFSLPLFCRGNDCEGIWRAFEQAYVGKDPCDVPAEAYDSLIHSVTQHVACGTMLFWSKTNSMAHAFTDNRECLSTLEDTLLGFMFDGLTWCSRNGSQETFTTDCPGWSACQDNPVRSFWIRASTNVSMPNPLVLRVVGSPIHNARGAGHVLLGLGNRSSDIPITRLVPFPSLSSISLGEELAFPEQDMPFTTLRHLQQE